MMVMLLHRKKRRKNVFLPERPDNPESVEMNINHFNGYGKLPCCSKCFQTFSFLSVVKKESYEIFLKCITTQNSFRYICLCSTHATSAQILCLFHQILQYIGTFQGTGCLKKK